MEIVKSAVVGELVSRFISFLMNKYHSNSHAQSEKVVERLQRLLMRLSTVVEEADARYITNSVMQLQLKMLSEAMYGGYSVLDTLRYRTIQDSAGFHEHNNPPGDHAPAVLPIIGGAAIGKKTLVAHVCSDERVRSRFSSILHLNGDSLLKILDHDRTMEGMILVVIEFASDVGDDDWKKLHSLLITMGRGIKIIIVSKLKRLARFRSVKPIFLSILSYDELRYLFKTLAFGSVDPAEHPRLVQIADQFAKVLHNAQASLVTINKVADVLRRNLDAQFWRCILDKGIKMAKRNLSIHGVHPRILIEQGHPVDISHMTDLASHPLSMTPYTINASIEKQPSVTFGELLTDPSVRPKGDFILISWESRIPPHKSFVHFVTSHAQDTHEASAVPGRKRRGVPV
ncbi:unnamed protein product [Triticum aestivum]|uniref:Disease resistance N-terminal domain-containing protein n=1 Tax=Triticum aestivum TaxID=4565 RepID=A0A7H4LAG7_WHEAT|nr:unnamed protein product [Triticum aestivum]